MTNLNVSPPNVRQVNGNMLSTRLPALAHGVNTQGVMGSGVAKVIRDFYPQVFGPYASACASKVLETGGMLPVKVTEDRWVFNLASQDLPGAHARMDWLEDSLDATFAFCEEESVEGFAIPRIGAGIGGLDWNDVLPLLLTKAAAHPKVKMEIWSL
jgi:O-acetyl-ADP-ribose deacetylase (regulator of RNase III)